MEAYRLDRTAFKIQTFEAARHNRAYWMAKAPRERLEAAWYLVCSAYNLSHNASHQLDRTIFSMRKQG
jgi:hypothetical protein